MQEISAAQVDAHVVAEVVVADGVEADQVAALQIVVFDLLEAVVVALGIGGALQQAALGRAVAVVGILGAVEGFGGLRVAGVGHADQALGHVDGLFDLGALRAFRGGQQRFGDGIRRRRALAAVLGGRVLLHLGGGQLPGLDVALGAALVLDAHIAAVHAQHRHRRARGHRGQLLGAAGVLIHRGVLGDVGRKGLDPVQVLQLDIARAALVGDLAPALGVGLQRHPQALGRLDVARGAGQRGIDLRRGVQLDLYGIRQGRRAEDQHSQYQKQHARCPQSVTGHADIPPMVV